MIQTGQVPTYLNPQQQQQLQQMYMKQTQQQQVQACSANTAQPLNTSTTMTASSLTETAMTQPTVTMSVSSANQYEHHNGVDQQITGETSNHPLSATYTAGSTTLTLSEVSSIPPVSGDSQLVSSQCLKPLSVNTKQEPSSMEIDEQGKILLNAKSEVSLNGRSVSAELMDAITTQESSSFTPSSLELTVSTTSASQTTSDIAVSHDMLSGSSTNFNPSSVLTGSSDPTLGSGVVSSNLEAVTVPLAPSSTGVSISPFSSPSYAVSPTPKLTPHSSFSPITTQPLTINPVSSCLSPGSSLHGNPLLSPSLISPNPLHLSPSQNLSLLSPSGSKSLLSTEGQFPIPKISLLLDENAIPTLPKVPSPPLPTDKLSPATPSIFVSIHIINTLGCQIIFPSPPCAY